MKILIPTDFSELSIVAIKYAVDLSKEVDVELVLLHVVDTDTRAGARLSTTKLEDTIKANSEEDMQKLVRTIQKENGDDLNIRHEVVFGSAFDRVVEAFALKNDIDMICIGTKGASGIKKILFGSNAAKIISNSSIPVLTIPEFARYKDIKSIIYSSDLKNIEEELKLILPFVKLVNSWIHVLHVAVGDDHYEGDLKDQEKTLRKNSSYEKIGIRELASTSIVQGINTFVADVDADMVIMLTHHTNLIEKVFQKSITQNTAFQTRIPLLTYQKGEYSS